MKSINEIKPVTWGGIYLNDKLMMMYCCVYTTFSYLTAMKESATELIDGLNNLFDVLSRLFGVYLSMSARCRTGVKYTY